MNENVRYGTGGNISLDDVKRQQHSKDTLINNWQHSAR